MRTILITLSLLLAISVEAQPTKTIKPQSPARPLGTDPIRIVDGREHDLRAMFEWYRRPYRDNPAPHWQIVSGVVSQTIEGGLLVEGEKEARFLLKNHPNNEKFSDGMQVKAFALKVDSYRYTSVGAGAITIPAYDYGTLPTPARLQQIAREDELRRKEIAAQQAVEAMKRAEEHEAALKASKAKMEDLRKRNAGDPKPKP